MQNNKIQIGVIADDFTGASDAASFLAKGGAKTIMLNEIPRNQNIECDAIVVALKTRSVEPNQAIIQTKKAIDFLMNLKCEKIYFKYCSTFDSTPKGNIGVVGDFLMDYLNVPYTILCPSLPVNGRQVKDGILYVNGVKLSESPMKNHPLNPMWDSYIPMLMKDQSKYACYPIDKKTLEENLENKVVQFMRTNEPFYLIPDYMNDVDGALIGEKFKNLKLLTGGSGLLEFVLDKKNLQGCDDIYKNDSVQRCIILCGSCSAASKRQVHTFKENNGKTYSIDAFKLLNHTLSVQEVLEYIMNRDETVLVYSDAIDNDINILRKREGFEEASKKLEIFMAELSKQALKVGFSRIVVGGGETSGAVTKALGFDEFYIGKSVDPGVPELIPIQRNDVTLILKSGNFGSDEFFMKASGDYKYE